MQILARLELPPERLTSLEIELLSYPGLDADGFRDTLDRCKSLKVDPLHGLAFDTDFSICLPSLKFLLLGGVHISLHTLTEIRDP